MNTNKFKYEKARLLSNGDGVSDTDAVREFITIDLKQYYMCPHYSRKVAIFCKKENVQATDEFDSCLDNLTLLSDCEDPPSRSQNRDTYSHSRYAIERINEDEIYDVDAEAEIDLDKLTLPDIVS